MNAYPDQAALVQHEANKRARHMPLRKLLAQAPDVLTALFPCWMASPLAVSQLIGADRRYFDVVLFDEASQVLPEDAVAALLRGTRAVVAGDRNQLPPTIFFAGGEDDQADDGDDVPPTAGFESLLDLMSGFVQPWPLDWHYRSRDERLIAFANHHVYGDRLVTFPSANEDEVIRHVVAAPPDGMDGQEDSPSPEVARVVELVLEHAENHPGESLGVITLGIKHATRVQAAIDRAFSRRPDLDAFFDESLSERFFVKNLERVQGDERDAIILTVAVGKMRGGRVDYRGFGPLNGEGGHRRLNVAITRARRRMTVVSSFTHLDMDPTTSRSGTALLRDYLQYAASGGRIFGGGRASTTPLNIFEADVKDALEAVGIPVVSQWGASKYRIDLVAQHPRREGQFVLAIECDGASYHSAPTARDRDRLRQQHLEALGWKFHRIWSTDWFLRRDEEIARAIQAYEQAVAAADSPRSSTPSTPPAQPGPPVLPAVTDAKRGPRPRLPQRQPIGTYRWDDLLALGRWVKSDGRLRTDKEILDEMVKELGYRQRGPRIEERLKRVIAALHQEEGNS
jgi:very-short-patch-repair endonuclease